MSTRNPIYVTQPSMPDLDAFIPYLKQIWESKVLTNGGPFHQRLENALCEYLGVEHLSLFANATIALVTALQALDASGEVITTPYSFVATAHSLLWNGITPVFVDIDPETLNLDPALIEAAVTERTTAIMPVHVYGTPCNHKAIQEIADRHGLKVLYDAAHAFGVQCDCGSILKHGDLSVLSFHATKVFSTFEGGAIISPNADAKLRIDQLKNFGFVDEVTVVAAGINGKLNEVSAAFGLLQLQGVEEAIERRKTVADRYVLGLSDVKGIRCLGPGSASRMNFGYFPTFVGPDFRMSRDDLYERLKQHGIYTRRYFYPLISDFPMYSSLPSAHRAHLPNAARAADEVLCLPIYPLLSESDQQRVIELIRGD